MVMGRKIEREHKNSKELTSIYKDMGKSVNWQKSVNYIIIKAK